MDCHGMKRKELQALCKKHSIPANLTNMEMANKLSAILKESERPATRERSCLKTSAEVASENDSDVAKRRYKRISFSPENELIEFEKSEIKIKQSKKNEVGKRRSMTRPATKNKDLVVDNANGDESSKEAVVNPVRFTRSQEQRWAKVDAFSSFSPSGQTKKGVRKVKDVDESDEAPPEVHLSANLDSRISAVGEIRMLTRRSLRNEKVVDDEKRYVAVDNVVLRKSTRHKDSRKRKEAPSGDRGVAQQEEALKRLKQSVGEVAQDSELMDGRSVSEMFGRERNRRSRSHLRAEPSAADDESKETDDEVQEEAKAVLCIRHTARNVRKRESILRHTNNKSENLKDFEVVLPFEEPKRRSASYGNRQKFGMPQTENKDEHVRKLEVILPIEEPKRHPSRHGRRQKSLLPQIENKDEDMGKLEVVLAFVEPKRRSARYGDRRKSVMPETENNDENLKKLEVLLPLEEPKKNSCRYDDRKKSAMPQTETKVEDLEKLQVVLPLEEPKRLSARCGGRQKTVVPQTETKYKVRGKLEVVLQLEEPYPSRNGNRRWPDMHQNEEVGSHRSLTAENNSKPPRSNLAGKSSVEAPEEDNMVLQHNIPLRRSRRNTSVVKSIASTKEGFNIHEFVENMQAKEPPVQQEHPQIAKHLRRPQRNAIRNEALSVSDGMNGIAIATPKNRPGRGRGRPRLEERIDVIKNVPVVEKPLRQFKHNVSKGEKVEAAIAAGCVDRKRKQGGGLKSSASEAEASSLEGVATLRELRKLDSDQSMLDLAKGVVNPVSGSREVEDDTIEERQQSSMKSHAKSHDGLEAVIVGTSELDKARSFPYLKSVEMSACSVLKSQSVQKVQETEISVDDSTVLTEEVKFLVGVNEEDLSETDDLERESPDRTGHSVCNNLVDTEVVKDIASNAGFTDTDHVADVDPFANQSGSTSKQKEMEEGGDLSIDTNSYPNSSDLVDVVDERIPVYNKQSFVELEAGSKSLPAGHESVVKDDVAATVISETPNKIHGRVSDSIRETRDVDAPDRERLEAIIQEYMEVAEELVEIDEIQASNPEPEVQNIELGTPIHLSASEVSKSATDAVLSGDKEHSDKMNDMETGFARNCHSEKQHYPIEVFLDVSNQKVRDHTVVNLEGGSVPMCPKQQNESNDLVSGITFTDTAVASNTSEAEGFSFAQQSDHIEQPSNAINSGLEVELKEPSSIEHEVSEMGAVHDHECDVDSFAKGQNLVESDRRFDSGQLKESDKIYEVNSDTKLHASDRKSNPAKMLQEQHTTMAEDFVDVGERTVTISVLNDVNAETVTCNFTDKEFSVSSLLNDVNAETVTCKFTDKEFSVSSLRSTRIASCRPGFGICSLDGMEERQKENNPAEISPMESVLFGDEKNNHESFDGTIYMDTRPLHVIDDTNQRCVNLDRNLDLVKECSTVSEGVRDNGMHENFNGGQPAITQESDNGGAESLHSTVSPKVSAIAINDVSCHVHAPSKESDESKLVNNCQNSNEREQLSGCASEIDIGKNNSMVGDVTSNQGESQKLAAAEGVEHRIALKKVGAVPANSAVTINESPGEFQQELATFSEVELADGGISMDNTFKKLQKERFNERESQEMIVPEDCQSDENFVHKENALPVANEENTDGASSQSWEEDQLKLLFSTPVNDATSHRDKGTYSCGTKKGDVEMSVAKSNCKLGLEIERLNQGKFQDKMGEGENEDDNENSVLDTSEEIPDGGSHEGDQLRILFATPIKNLNTSREEETFGHEVKMGNMVSAEKTISQVRKEKFSQTQSQNTVGKECENEEALDQGNPCATNGEDIIDEAPSEAKGISFLNHTTSNGMTKHCEASDVEETVNPPRSILRCLKETQMEKEDNNEGILSQIGALGCEKVVLFDADNSVKRSPALSLQALSEEGCEEAEVYEETTVDITRTPGHYNVHKDATSGLHYPTDSEKGEDPNDTTIYYTGFAEHCSNEKIDDLDSQNNIGMRSNFNIVDDKSPTEKPAVNHSLQVSPHFHHLEKDNDFNTVSYTPISPHIVKENELEHGVGLDAEEKVIAEAAADNKLEITFNWDRGYDLLKWEQKGESVEEKIPDTKRVESKNKSPSRPLNSTTVKRKNDKANMVLVSPSKLLMASDMKENAPNVKREHIRRQTISKSTTKRRALEDLRKD